MNSFEKIISEVILESLNPFNLHFTSENAGYLLIEDLNCHGFDLWFEHNEGKFVRFTGCNPTNNHYFDPWTTLNSLVEWDDEFLQRELRKIVYFLDGRKSMWSRGVENTLKEKEDVWKHDLEGKFDEEMFDFLDRYSWKTN